MISDRSKGIQNLVLMAQCVLVSAAFWLWLPLCFEGPTINKGVVKSHAVYNVFLVLSLIAASNSLRKDLGLRVPTVEETTRRSFRQLVGTLFFFCFLLFLYFLVFYDIVIGRESFCSVILNY